MPYSLIISALNQGCCCSCSGSWSTCLFKRS